MDGYGVREVLQEVADGRMSVDDAVLRLKQKPFEDLGFAKVDLHRGLRQGVPEVIFGAGKTPAQITSIAQRMLERGETSVLITRMSPEAAEIVSESIDIRYDPVSRIGVAGALTDQRVGKITVMTAGTSDIPVAEEAAQTAEALGNNVVRVFDAGVSGIHRLLAHSDDIIRHIRHVPSVGMVVPVVRGPIEFVHGIPPYEWRSAKRLSRSAPSLMLSMLVARFILEKPAPPFPSSAPLARIICSSVSSA